MIIGLIQDSTRLLGCPQPQMYPPVTLNQHTLVNRTHKHYIYIYASRPHKHFTIDFTPKLSSQQHVQYGSNLMNLFYNIFSFFGGPGEAYVESRDLY